MKNLFDIRYFKVNTIINFFDYFLLTIVIFTLLGDFISLLYSINNYLFEIFNINGLDLIHIMVDNKSNVSTSTTSTTIIHDDGSWSNTIRSLFIYGVGGYRLSLLKAGGTPGAKAFTIAATLASDAGAKILNNTINDPSYVKNHYNSWSFIWKDLSKGEASVTVDEDTSNKLSNIISNNNKLIGGDDGLYDLSQALINGAFERLKFILEPVQVNYSNEILSNQIHDISLILFIMGLAIFGLIAVLLLNILIYINMDKIIKIFNNKFIQWYLIINKKFLSIEIFILGSTILYFMYNLIKGIHFIATHPIIIT